MDTKDVIARFEAERQALALMEHPNVAKVLDAGSTESGRPYFVMELVKGVSITEFCDQQKLSTRERLELFVDICRAVQHAHQKGIIHRDLKPSNIMVTMHDDKAVPKVIDFGVSKALSRKLTDKTVYTAYDQMIGTPLYMSPEQAQMSGLDVDTRSDVYSLGVLLYEMLTGTTPFDKQTFQKAGFDEMRRMIREDEPPRPSARISTLRAELLSTISDQRRIDPRKLGNTLRGELDWIVMKSLEKDRDRRYETASNIAADVERYLHDEPIEARPATLGYRLWKFARRNRAAMVTVVAVGTALLLGTVISSWQAFRAQAAAQRANVEAARARTEAEIAQETRLLMMTCFEDLLRDEPERQAKVGPFNRHALRFLLNSEAKKLEKSFDGKPVVEVSIRVDLARMCLALHESTKAQEHLQRAEESIRLADGSPAEIVQDLQRKLSRTRKLLEHLADSAASKQEK